MGPVTQLEIAWLPGACADGSSPMGNASLEVDVNSRQRILTALDRKQPDAVPIFESQIDEPVVVRTAKLLGLQTYELPTTDTFVYAEESPEVLDLYCLVVKALGLDATCRTFSIGITSIDSQHGRDKYGCVYQLSQHGEPMVMAGPIKEPSDIAGFEMASSLKPDDFAQIRYVVEKVGKDKAHFMAMNDPFKIAWLLRGGMANLLMDYAWNPDLVHRLTRVAADFLMAAIDIATGLGIDAILMEGDLAGEITTLVSPRHYRQFIKPYHTEIVDHAHRQGLRIVKHTDGNAWPIMDDLAEVGFDGFHPVQPQCMDISEVKRRMAGKLCVLGNIDCRHLLPFGASAEVEEAVKQTIAVAAPGGGYIISSSNSVHAGCKAENYVAMVMAAHKYGVYA